MEQLENWVIKNGGKIELPKKPFIATAYQFDYILSENQRQELKNIIDKIK